MSDIKTTLIELVRYYNSNRGVGHTTAVVAGAENMEDCIVVAANRLDAHRLAAGDMFTVITLAELEEGDKVRGRECPMVLDNYALTELAHQSLAEIRRLEDKIAEMKAVAQAIADVNLYD